MRNAGRLPILALLAAACGADAPAVPADAALPADAPLAPDGNVADARPADAAPADAAAPAPVVLRKARTRRIGRLFGTERTPIEPIGLIGSDLGVSFTQAGRLWFLFGDSWTTQPFLSAWDTDSVAWTSPELPANGSVPPLTWLLGPGGRFMSLSIPTIDLLAFNVPVEGVPMGDRTYVFATTGWNGSVHARSVLAHADGLGFASLVLDHAVATTRFFNIQVVAEGDVLWIFASGPYRKSPVYLARVAAATLADRGSWRYWDGASFVAGEDRARPIVDVSCVGELSVRRHPTLGLYLMAYNCDTPRGVVLRTAPAPTGPWSAGEVLFDPGADADGGYEVFLHARTSAVGFDDGLSERGREEEWGGEYGPYLIPSYFGEGPRGVHRLVYVLSTWNPYAVHLMETVLVEEGVTAPPAPNPGAGLPPTTLRNADFSQGLDGWQRSGDAFVTFTGADGRPRLTTFVQPEGDGVVGAMWQELTVDATVRALEFAVHGGHAVVELVHGADVVRTTRGRDTNASELPVRWRLGEYRGETLRLRIRDDETGPWGFIGVSGFTLRY
jgi:hypothetical protein